MRPSRGLLLFAFGALAVSVLVIAVPVLPTEAALGIWAVLGLAVVADAALSPNARSVDPVLDMPSEVYAGESVDVSLRLQPLRGRALPPRVSARLALPEGLGGSGDFEMRGPDGTLGISGRKRGKFELRSLWLQWPGRLGLLDFVPRYTLERRLAVVPNIRPVRSGVINVAISSTLYGVKENMMRGEGSEFHQLRDFTTGMDPRSIDWKRSARRRNLVAKEMRAERNHQIILALDNGYLMREEIDGLPKIDHAINAALAMTWAAGLGGDLVGFFSFDAQPRVYLPPLPGRSAFPRLRRQAAELEYSNSESNHTLAMAHLNGRLQRRSLIIVFSDFVDTTTAELLVENIQVLNRSHVMVFVALRNPGLENRVRAQTHSLQAVAEAVSAGQMLYERQIVLDRLAQIGVICIDVEPKRLTAELVSIYLTIKARELI